MTDSNTVRTRNNNVRVRKNVRSLSPKEVNDLRNAYEGLYKVSEDGGNADERGYQWIAGVHGLPTPIYCQHGTLNFPTWHRAYIYEFEMRLQEIVPSVMLPYWDWTSEESLAEGLPKVLTEETYTDLNTGEEKRNPLLTAFSQVTGGFTVRSPSPVSGLQLLKNQVEFALRQRTYDRFSPRLEQPHGGLHVWVGGDMGSVPTSSYDPVFWMHHCNVDKQWSDWQRQHGNDTVPQEVKDFVCAPFSFTGEQTLDTRFFGYTYVESESTAAITPETVQPEVEAGKLSFDIPVEAEKAFEHAFLEFQGISKTTESLQLNIFLKENPKAENPFEPSVEEGYADTLYLLGHGECAGGVGHCSLKRKSAFDKRPEHHLTPFNTYADITEAYKKYDRSSGNLDISILAYDADGNKVSAKEVKIDGISLVTHL